MPRFGEGPPNARIMLVGEVFSEQEERTGLPFQGTSGLELNKMLSDAGSKVSVTKSWLHFSRDLDYE